MSAKRLSLTLVEHLPTLASGAALHRAALEAMASGRFEQAERLFEQAAVRYRAEVQVESLARLRVHQLIARLRSGAVSDASGELALDVERRLCRLQRIESLEPPFALTDARRLVGHWQASSDDRLRPAA